MGEHSSSNWLGEEKREIFFRIGVALQAVHFFIAFIVAYETSYTFIEILLSFSIISSAVWGFHLFRWIFSIKWMSARNAIIYGLTCLIIPCTIIVMFFDRDIDNIETVVYGASIAFINYLIFAILFNMRYKSFKPANRFSPEYALIATFFIYTLWIGAALLLDEIYY